MNPIHINIEQLRDRSDLSLDLLEYLYELDSEYFPTSWDLISWKNLMIDSRNLLIILRDNAKIIGFSLFQVNEIDSFAHLLKILIIPSFRQQNLASFLLSKSIMILGEDGIKNVYLEVEQTNSSALKLYEKYGFNIIHSKKDFYGSNRSAFIMTNFNV